MEKEKLKKQVQILNYLLINGTIKESEFDSLLIQGVNPKVLEVWKDAYEVARMVSKKRSRNIIGYDLVGQILDSEAFEEVYELKYLDQHKVEIEPTKDEVDLLEEITGQQVQVPKSVEKCTDCGSPERNMMEPKAVASVEQQKNIQKQFSLGETIEFQNQIKDMVFRMKDLKTSYDVFYSGEYFDRIKSIFDLAIERTPIATIEIKMLAELLQACESWHKNSKVFPNEYYSEWFKQQTGWLENQRDINVRALQGMLSDNNSLLDGLKKKHKQITKEPQAKTLMFEENKIPNKCNCDESSECSNCPSKNKPVIEFTDKNRSISADEIRWTGCVDGSKIQQFYKKGVFVKEERLEKVVPNKVKCEFDENGFEKRSYYKGDQFVYSVDAFGDRSDQPKNSVVARNIEEIAKQQRDERQSKRDRLKKYRTKVEGEWKNSTNNTERILEKKNKPEELFGYEKLLKTGEVNANNLKEAVKILSEYTNGIENESDEDNFIATPIDVKGTDGPFRRKLPNKIEPNVVEKQEKKSKLTELIRSISQAAKNGLISSLDAEKSIKYHKISDSEGSDAAKKFLDGVKAAPEEFAQKLVDEVKKEKIKRNPMFNLSLWQKTKVYFRDLKNKASTLFKSPEITEEEVDRAIQLMEKQIAEIKRSKNPTPEMYDRLFDRLLPKKDRKYHKQSEQEQIVDMMSSFEIKKPNQTTSKVLLNKEDIELLKKFKTDIEMVNEIPRHEKFGGESIYIAEHNLFEQARTLIRYFERSVYPYLNNCFVKLEDLNRMAKVGNVDDNFGVLLKKAYQDFVLEVAQFSSYTDAKYHS
jgi:hypothetical protein